MICFHRWSKWAQKEISVNKLVTLDIPEGATYNGPLFVSDKELWQSRKCKKCGKLQMEYAQ